MPTIARKNNVPENPFFSRAAEPQSAEGQMLRQEMARANGEFIEGVAGHYLGEPAVAGLANERIIIRIPPLSFLRAMALIAWQSFRHPLTTTLIDIEHGECVQY